MPANRELSSYPWRAVAWARIRTVVLVVFGLSACSARPEPPPWSREPGVPGAASGVQQIPGLLQEHAAPLISSDRTAEAPKALPEPQVVVPDLRDRQAPLQSEPKELQSAPVEFCHCARDTSARKGISAS